MRQGPHHSAQKSTSTGTSEFNTSMSQVASVNVKVLTPDILLCSLPYIDVITAKKDSAGQKPIKCPIFNGSSARGEVLPHTTPHHGRPIVLTLVNLYGRPNGIQQRGSRIILELESCILINGIIQTAGGAN